jgi:hypothetical protein
MSPIGASIARFAAIRQLDRVYGSDKGSDPTIGMARIVSMSPSVSASFAGMTPAQRLVTDRGDFEINLTH